MNQQRSRRFRSAQEAKEKHEEKEAALAEWKCKHLMHVAARNALLMFPLLDTSQIISNGIARHR